MELVLILFGVTSAIELAVVSNTKLYHRYITDGLCLILAIVCIYIANFSLHPLSLAVLAIMIYRAINLERLTHRLLQDDYVYHLALRASIVLIGIQAVLLDLLAAATNTMWLPDVFKNYGYISVVISLLVVAAWLAQTVRHNSRATRVVLPENNTSPDFLPTVTVLIPARNEDDDLQACLQTLISSTYPKLEIIVLDDCSQNAHTPDIIRSFAHNGVRFIAGTQPPVHWLAKNHAYQQLIEQSNGEVLLFCGVDIRFEPGSITSIIQTMFDRKKTMISVMPRNKIPGRFSFEASLVQPGRYAWELMLPRRLVDRPPVLSSCWVARKEIIKAAGGVKAVSRTVSPERFFARYAARHNDGYAFVQSGESLGVASVKSFDEQRSTAFLVRYPSLHRRIELVVAVTALEFGALLLPYFLWLKAWTSQNQIGITTLGITVMLLSYSYGAVLSITYGKTMLRGIWLMPVAVLYDLALLHVSMWKYEFSEVVWKGRNVCIPVMRVIPHLPEFEPSQQIHTYNRHGYHGHKGHRRHRRHH